MEGVRKASDVPLPGGNFHLFVSRLSIQAMISMGILENPLTKRKEVHPGNARMLLDDLAMLREIGLPPRSLAFRYLVGSAMNFA
jgi:hypothetical protein